jgi:hypothetical protein
MPMMGGLVGVVVWLDQIGGLDQHHDAQQRERGNGERDLGAARAWPGGCLGCLAGMRWRAHGAHPGAASLVFQPESV